MSEYKTENLNHRISINILFKFIIPEHESAKENNMFLNDHCCFKKLISIRTTPELSSKRISYGVTKNFPRAFK
jgi:hypothetical protein